MARKYDTHEDPDSISGDSPNPGSEVRSNASNTEAADDQTGFGSEFQMRRRQAQARVVEGMNEGKGGYGPNR